MANLNFEQSAKKNGISHHTPDTDRNGNAGIQANEVMVGQESAVKKVRILSILRS